MLSKRKLLPLFTENLCSCPKTWQDNSCYPLQAHQRLQKEQHFLCKGACKGIAVVLVEKARGGAVVVPELYRSRQV